MDESTVRLPLHGIRVLDMSEVWAGPMGTSFLGDLGADVVRVESYPRLNTMRPRHAPAGSPGFSDDDPLAERPWERHARYHLANRNKRAIAINLKSREGMAALFRLSRTADVIVDGYSTGTLTRLGFSPDEAMAENDQLVYVSAPGWGTIGAYSRFVTMGSGLDAFTGHTWLRGYFGEDASRTNDGYQSDATAALAIVIGVAGALRQRRRTGRGTFIEIAQFETLLPSLAYSYLHSQVTGEPARFENRHPVYAPQGAYPCSGPDEWIVISIQSDAEWVKFCHLIDLPNLAERFPTHEQRREGHDEIDGIISAWTLRWQKGRLMQRLQDSGVAASAVRREEEVAGDPGLSDYWQTVSHRYVGTRRHSGGLWQRDGQWTDVRRPPNLFGEHNDEVLTELGYTADEIARLYATGAVANSDTIANE